MSTDEIKRLPGFREFFPDACALRNYLFAHWREVARCYGFVEYEGPVLEPTDLYRRKSGDEIVKQLFHFTDGGGREVALRPETTPSLARMAAARQRDFRKPLKWFQIGPCFRYETPQKGRGREFYQFNCDILGDATGAADADLVAMAVDVMRALGFAAGDFLVRLSDRNVWPGFLASEGVDPAALTEFLQIIDKLEREKPEVSAQRLSALGTSVEAVRAFIESGAPGYEPLARLAADLDARGMTPYIRIDPGIVRGLAYYTGTVFEIFDARQSLRAVAGGGRYDNLCQLIGGTDLPAMGFAMGDMVIAEFIRETPCAQRQLQEWLVSYGKVSTYVVVADETRRPDALAAVQALRSAGISCDYPYAAAKVGKQFQAAEGAGARVAVLVGSEFPEVRLKDLASRTETALHVAGLPDAVREILAKPASPPLIA